MGRIHTSEPDSQLLLTLRLLSDSSRPPLSSYKMEAERTCAAGRVAETENATYGKH